MGRRPFDDAGGTEAAQLLAKWRDAGYFSPDAGQKGMEESIASVEAGQALFVLMGSFASDRFRVPADIGFMQVPFWNGRGNPRGEIAGVSGFAITSWSSSPEAALALVDSYLLAEGTEPASGTYQLPILFQKNDAADLRGVQSRILAGARWIVPSQERIMLPRFVQDSLKEWAGFFAPGSEVSGTGLAAALQSLRIAAEKGVSP
jgi:maltose-binding protein MalE